MSTISSQDVEEKASFVPPSAFKQFKDDSFLNQPVYSSPVVVTQSSTPSKIAKQADVGMADSLSPILKSTQVKEHIPSPYNSSMTSVVSSTPQMSHHPQQPFHMTPLSSYSVASTHVTSSNPVPVFHLNEVNPEASKPPVVTKQIVSTTLQGPILASSIQPSKLSPPVPVLSSHSEDQIQKQRQDLSDFEAKKKTSVKETLIYKEYSQVQLHLQEHLEIYQNNQYTLQSLLVALHDGMQEIEIPIMEPLIGNSSSTVSTPGYFDVGDILLCDKNINLSQGEEQLKLRCQLQQAQTQLEMEKQVRGNSLRQIRSLTQANITKDKEYQVKLQELERRAVQREEEHRAVLDSLFNKSTR